MLETGSLDWYVEAWVRNINDEDSVTGQWLADQNLGLVTNQFLLEPFVNYNLDNGWYLVTDMVMTANWMADSGNRWTVPVGGGVANDAFGASLAAGDADGDRVADLLIGIPGDDAAAPAVQLFAATAERVGVPIGAADVEMVGDPVPADLDHVAGLCRRRRRLLLRHDLHLVDAAAHGRVALRVHVDQQHAALRRS